jgi:hypothetical protein
VRPAKGTKSPLQFWLQSAICACIKKCVLGGTGVGGIGGKALVRDQLGVIAQVAAAAAPVLVTAAVPRDLRVDPCERKSKRDEPGRVEERSVIVAGAGLVGIAISLFTPGTPQGSSQKYALSDRGRSPIFQLKVP